MLQNLIIVVAKSGGSPLRRAVAREGCGEGMASGVQWLTVSDVMLRRHHTIAVTLLCNLYNGWRRRRGWRRIVRGGMSGSRQHHQRQPYEGHDGMVLHDFTYRLVHGKLPIVEWHSTNSLVLWCHSSCSRRPYLGKKLSPSFLLS